MSALLLVSAGGCRSGACTQIGCADVPVSVHLPGLADVPGTGSVTACVGDDCTSTPVSASELAGGATVETPVLRDEHVTYGRASVRVEVVGQDGQVVFADRARPRVTTTQPNGRGCPPRCVSADGVNFAP